MHVHFCYQPTNKKKNNRKQGGRSEYEVLMVREKTLYQDGGGGKVMKGSVGRRGEVVNPGCAGKSGELFTEGTFVAIGGDVAVNSCEVW